MSEEDEMLVIYWSKYELDIKYKVIFGGKLWIDY